MYLSEFFSLYNGKKLDVDSAGSAANKNQCVDVIKAYCSKVFGVSVSSMSGYGDAWEYYDNFSKKSAITPHFIRLAYSKGMKLLAGDIVCWDRSINKSSAGHIAVATGKYSSTSFESFDQNFPSGSPCGFVVHSYTKVKGILRPKDFSKIVKEEKIEGTGSFPSPIIWKNGSTPETLYSCNDLTGAVLTLNKGATAHCYSKAGNAYLIVATRDGGRHATAGFAGYAGGISYAPPDSKTWTNGSTAETVYADVDKKIKVGSLNPYEKAYCLAKRSGMYLVLYRLDNSEVQKCGFVSYSGGVLD